MNVKTIERGIDLHTTSEFYTLVLQSILEEIDVGLHVVDEKGSTVIYNKKMMQIEDMDERDVLHKNLTDVFMFSNQQDSTLVQALQEGKTIKNVKQSYFNNKGQEITTINHTFPIVQNGEIKGAVEIAKDVTKLERLIRRTCTGKNRTATRLTVFSATAQLFGKSSKTQNGQPAHHHRCFWPARRERARNCSPKAFTTAVSAQAPRSSHKTAPPCRIAWSKVFYSARKRRLYRSHRPARLI